MHFFAIKFFTKKSAMDINMNELLAEQDALGWGPPEDSDDDSEPPPTITLGNLLATAMARLAREMARKIALAGG